jgi:hypothetical protein
MSPGGAGIGTPAIILGGAGAALLLLGPVWEAAGVPAGRAPRPGAVVRLGRRIGALLVASALVLTAGGLAAAGTGAPGDAPAAGPSARALTPDPPEHAGG